MPELPPFLFAAKAQSQRRLLARLKQEGRVRAIAPRLYTSLPERAVPEATRSAWSTIVAGLFPGALLSHRTALEYKPSPDGVVFLTSKTNRKFSYPGLTLQFVRGPEPLSDDPRFVELRASSIPRALLENLMPDPRSAFSRVLPIEELEQRLEQILQAGGEAAVNQIRDRAQEIAHELGWRAELERLDGIIGALLGTRSLSHVKSAAAQARALGEPFDVRCLARLQLLFGELRTRSLRTISDAFHSAEHVRNKAFFEAYFSNYIEGTTFEIEEAEAIVFDKQIPVARPIDAHDIVGTFTVVSNTAEMRRTPSSPDALLELLRARHKTILERRPEIRPGTFKQSPNRAGETVFVIPDYVIGTLKKGYALYADLDPGIARAIFVMFLISDVHPFNDGNGRVARVMMNAELVAAGAPTIIIPNVHRDDYLNGLRALTRRDRPALLVDVLVRALSLSHLDFADYRGILDELRRHNWFREPDDARII